MIDSWPTLILEVFGILLARKSEASAIILALQDDDDRHMGNRNRRLIEGFWRAQAHLQLDPQSTPCLSP